jgi:hypothetical protein
MSLAMTAATIDNEYQNETPIERKKQANNRTQKRMPNIRPEKVKSVLDSIYNSEDSDNLGDFNAKYTSANAGFKPITQPIDPYNPPTLTREPSSQKEGMSTYDANTNNSKNYSSKYVPQPAQDDSMDLQELGGVYMNDEQVKKYFKNLVPNYEGGKNNGEHNKNYYNQTRFSNMNSSSAINNDASFSDANQVLIEKLNYMINLLEDQQDEKTNNVTEEVVLYSFLGVFIIFVVDSFARVSKYVR